MDYRNIYRKEWAFYTPAISAIYARSVTKGVSRSISIPIDDLDIFSPNTPLYQYPFGLYSAGQAATSANSARQPDIITSRPSDIFIIGDSGGYQIGQGTMPWKGQPTRDRIRNWLTQVCDISMVLDFPLATITKGKIREHIERLQSPNNISDVLYRGGSPVSLAQFPASSLFGLEFGACLYQTLVNNDDFESFIPSTKARHLNVIQGRNRRETAYWLNHVSHYAFSGWAFAGQTNIHELSIALENIIVLRDGGHLKDKEWLHFLGVGRPEHLCAFSEIKSCLSKDFPNINVTADSSSPFMSAGKGNIYVGYTLGSTKWDLQSVNLDGEELVESNVLLEAALRRRWIEKYVNIKGLREYRKRLESLRQLFDFEDSPNPRRFVSTEISKRIKVGDVCVVRNRCMPIKPVKANEITVESFTWDTLSYLIIMNHNLQVTIEFIIDGLRCYHDRIPEMVPDGLYEMGEVIREVLVSEKPMSVINRNRAVLDEFGKFQKG